MPQSKSALANRLWKLRLLSSNQQCCDCGAASPVWSSTAFKNFICLHCAGVHRSFGTDVTLVKNVMTDLWTEAEVLHLENNGGNLACNQTLELYPDEVNMERPTRDSSFQVRKKWITAKYIEQKFTEGGDEQKRMHETKKRLATQMPVRFVDYFLVMGRGVPTLETISGNEAKARRQSAFGIEEEYKHSILDVVYTSSVVDRFPSTDYIDFELPKGVANFLFPTGLQLVLNIENTTATMHRFVLTKLDGRHMYGTCLKFYEKLSSLELVRLTAELQEFRDSKKTLDTTDGIAIKQLNYNDPDVEIFSPVAICVLSHWSFLSAFEQCLRVIKRISTSSAPLPLERYIAQFVTEVPIPPQGKTAVRFSLGDDVIHLTRPPPNELPFVDVDWELVFRLIKPEDMIQLVLATALERKIIIIGEQWNQLTHIAQALTALIFPFHWQGVYLPLLPLSLCDFLFAPVPFIAGIHVSYLDRVDLPREDVVVLDLSKKTLTVFGDKIPFIADSDYEKLLHKVKDGTDGMYNPHHPRIATSMFAFPNREDLLPVTAFGSETGIRLKDPATDVKQPSKSKKKKKSIKSSNSGFAIGNNISPFSDDTAVVELNAVRSAFLRVWVKLFQHYRQFFTPALDSKATKNAFGHVIPPEGLKAGHDGRPQSLFIQDAFLKDSQENSDFLTEMMGAQHVQVFLDERWTKTGMANPEEDSFEIRLFDNHIKAKENRSVLNALSKSQTPFLEDKSFAVTETFIVPPTNTSGIEDAVYQYEGFPKMNTRNLPAKPRYIKPLITGGSFRRTMLSDLFKATSTGESSDGGDGGAALLHARKKHVVIITNSKSGSRMDHEEAILCIQKHFRGFRVRRRLRQERKVAMMARNKDMLEAVVTLQGCVRAVIALHKTQGLTPQIRTYQAYIRAALAVHATRSRIKMRVMRVQAYARGFLTRHLQKRSLHSEFENRCSQLVDSWNSVGASLWYRAAFVELVWGNVSYFNLAIMENEHNSIMDMKVSTDSVSAAERISIYTILSRLPNASKTPIYTLAGIDPRGKQRKKRFIAALFTDDLPDGKGGAARKKVADTYRTSAQCMKLLAEKNVQTQDAYTLAHLKIDNIMLQHRLHIMSQTLRLSLRKKM